MCVCVCVCVRAPVCLSVYARARVGVCVVGGGGGNVRTHALCKSVLRDQGHTVVFSPVHTFNFYIFICICKVQFF